MGRGQEAVWVAGEVRFGGRFLGKWVRLGATEEGVGRDGGEQIAKFVEKKHCVLWVVWLILRVRMVYAAPSRTVKTMRRGTKTGRLGRVE
jgi:hypothetical protein